MKREDEEGQKKHPTFTSYRMTTTATMHTGLHFFRILTNNHVLPPLEHYPYHFLPHTILNLGQRCITLVCKVLVDGEDVNIHPVGLGPDRRGRCRMFDGYDIMLLVIAW
jgi:hypothetical protein